MKGFAEKEINPIHELSDDYDLLHNLVMKGYSIPVLFDNKRWGNIDHMFDEDLDKCIGTWRWHKIKFPLHIDRQKFKKIHQ